MPDIYLDAEFFSHEKTTLLIRLLGKGSEVVPLRLWCFAAPAYAESGKLARYSAQEIETGVGWWGKVGACVAALREARFIDEPEPGRFEIHNWEKRARHLVINRRRAVAAAEARWRFAEENASSNAPSIKVSAPSNARPPQVPPRSPSPKPPGFSSSNDEDEKRRAGANNVDARSILDAAFPDSPLYRAPFPAPSGTIVDVPAMPSGVSERRRNSSKKRPGSLKSERRGPPPSWEDVDALTPLQRVILAWKLVSGVDLDDAAWDAAHYARHCAAAADLLRYFGGSYAAAGRCIEWVWEDMARARRTCTLETVFKHSDRYKQSAAYRAAENGAGRED